MRNKRKRIISLMAAVLCMAAFCFPGFAVDRGYYASDESGSSSPPDAIDSITVSTEKVQLSANQGSVTGKPLTPDGNLTLIDDILQGGYFASVEESAQLENKQFVTVQTKSGNYFYLVIDRSGDQENVYFLNLVDEADLLALLEDEGTEVEPVACSCKDKCMVGAINTSCEICRTNLSDCTGREVVVSPEPDTDKEQVTEEPEPAKKDNSAALTLLILLIAAAGGGAFWWFKLRKPKTDTRGGSDLDDYDYGQDEDPDDTEYDDADVMAESEEHEQY